jgi:hypothetical protein
MNCRREDATNIEFIPPMFSQNSVDTTGLHDTFSIGLGENSKLEIRPVASAFRNWHLDAAKVTRSRSRMHATRSPATNIGKEMVASKRVSFI